MPFLGLLAFASLRVQQTQDFCGEELGKSWGSYQRSSLEYLRAPRISPPAGQRTVSGSPTLGGSCGWYHCRDGARARPSEPVALND